MNTYTTAYAYVSKGGDLLDILFRKFCQSPDIITYGTFSSHKTFDEYFATCMKLDHFEHVNGSSGTFVHKSITGIKIRHTNNDLLYVWSFLLPYDALKSKRKDNLTYTNRTMPSYEHTLVAFLHVDAKYYTYESCITPALS